MKPRTIPQNKKLSAMVGDVWKVYPLVPWKPAMAREAWKRFFIARFIREARMEAYALGQHDPFPVRPVPSSSLDSWEMDALIESTYAICATELNIILQ